MKLSNILIIGGIAAAMTSCSDYLDQAPKDKLSSDGFYATASQCEQGVLGVYSDLRYMSDYEYLMLSEVRSDNTWVETQPDGQRDYSDLCTFRATSSLGTFESCWNAWYKVIYDANAALSKIPNTTFDNDAIKQQNLNEMHFIRGWAYFELARLFGNIPVITEPLSPSAANSVKQTSAKTVIDSIAIPDMEAALNLPDKGAVLNAEGTAVPAEGRADRTAAEAMLARIYMTLAGYPFNDENALAKAKTYLDEVLAKKSNYWAPNITEWKKQWTPNYANKYSIFAIQYRTGGTGNPAVFDFSPALPPSYTTIRIFGNSIWLDKNLRAEFNKTYSTGSKDLRGNGYSFIDGYAAEGSNYPTYTNVKDTCMIDGIVDSTYTNSMFYKYLPSIRKLAALGMNLDEGTLKNYYDWPVNLPILRIEDMMLLNSEILIKEGKIPEALEAVNDIRERAGCDPVSTNVDATTALNFVKRERRIELMGEGVRWFDEIRYGTWEQNTRDKFNHYKNPTGTSQANIRSGNYLCPIPENQMSIKPGTYTQNPDW